MEPFERGKDKVDIVGFSETTRDQAHYDDPEYEIWGLNEEYQYPWMKRFDRWFQMHPAWDFGREGNANDPNHFLWLQNKSGMCLACRGEKHYKGADGKEKDCEWCKDGIYEVPETRKGLMIYMQEAFEYIPGAVKFPMQELTNAFLKRLGRPYFTSSPAFMLALALGMGYKTIGLYGFEMGTDTEYHYQRPCFEYWMGLAEGHGVNIELPKSSNLNSGKLYGYENMMTGYRQDVEMRKVFLNNTVTKNKRTLAQAEGMLSVIQEVAAMKDRSDEEINKLLAKIMKQHTLADRTLLFNQGASKESETLTEAYDGYFRREGKTVPSPEETIRWINLEYRLAGGEDEKKAQ